MNRENVPQQAPTKLNCHDSRRPNVRAATTKSGITMPQLDWLALTCSNTSNVPEPDQTGPSHQTNANRTSLSKTRRTTQQHFKEHSTNHNWLDRA
jgi:hypothetical protein